jgi:hypothetical protein
MNTGNSIRVRWRSVLVELVVATFRPKGLPERAFMSEPAAAIDTVSRRGERSRKIGGHRLSVVEKERKCVTV